MPQINTIKKLVTKYNSNQLIHGHIHNIETEEFTVNNQKIQRISLGEWIDSSGSFLVYHQDGRYEFKDLQKQLPALQRPITQ